MKYTRLGASYYVIYNPGYYSRDKHEVLEVYRLVDGVYMRQPDETVWIPEINLAIGKEQGTHQGWTREWLYWYDQEGNRYPSIEEQAKLAQQQAIQAEQNLESLLAKLRERGIDPDKL